jgi:hypothetical protein
MRLKRPEWKGRLELFEIYFLGGTDYRPAISLVGVAEGTFDYWLQEVKKAAGRNTLARDGIRHRIIFNRRTRTSLQAARRDKGDTVGFHSDSIRDIRMDALYNRRGKRFVIRVIGADETWRKHFGNGGRWLHRVCAGA